MGRIDLKALNGVAIGLGILLAATSTSFAWTLKETPRELQRAVPCMVSVLKGAKGIDHVRYGVRRDRSEANNAEPPWVHPYVRYRFTFPDGDTAEVTFDAYRHPGQDGEKYYFMARMSGLSAIGSVPQDYGAGQAARLWQAKCAVSATVFSM